MYTKKFEKTPLKSFRSISVKCYWQIYREHTFSSRPNLKEHPLIDDSIGK